MNINEIITDENLTVSIEEFFQYFTYGGLLEGQPSNHVNKMILTHIENRARKILELENIIILNPEPKNSESFGWDSDCELPRITCIALIKSIEVFKDLKKDFSCLGIIWFQKDFMFPIEDDILEKIKKIPFRKLCSEFEY
ncbi:hypothetical protein G6N05_15175 [Flavobacterium sp. F372]|uniref:Uncharacterized protein n=1 Tax=Flavobacterium bernardetii TaxID=2813823 RepID=A0ABR7J2T0_9FLAO|nr:hypothetical protein [Flavobacterium bernardetii]MBC5836238.1 hypothetical protein [Flavobacterium bernardetii]NHF71454.1 hypothetical protein [Flavobacterium bernardetii]